MSSVLGPLDLSSADLKGFDAVPAGRYNAEIAQISVDAVKNEGGKTPVGTPMIKVQCKLLSNDEGVSEGIENRRVFTQFVVPPKDYDQKKKEVMQGMIARFFIALGIDEAKVKSAKFDPDFDELVGTPVVVTLGYEPKKDAKGEIVEGEFNNPIKGFKPAGSIGAAAPGGIL